MNSQNTTSKSSQSFYQRCIYSDYYWPIERMELVKFLSIVFLMFCILCIQNLIRALKDSIVNTMIGTESVAFLKFWGVLPSAFLFTILYIKLVNNMKGEKIFYLILTSFLLFFAIFAFYIFPNYQTLHLSPESTARLVSSYPNFKWFIILLSNWSFSLFYITAELWPNAIYGLLFWQFVNNVVTVEESKRFYPLFGLLGQTGLYFSGQFLISIPNLNNYLMHKFNLHVTEHCLTIQIILGVVLTLGICAYCMFWLLNNKILASHNQHPIHYRIKSKSLGLIESFRMICSSRYIMLIATMLICYGIAINLVEAPWKSQVSQIYKTPTEFASFVGRYLSYTGLFTVIFVLIGSNVVRRLGWLTAAIITPLIVFITGIIFFLTVGFEEFIQNIVAFFVHIDITFIAITIGAMQNVLSKSSKYTLFDSTKEMVYVPLSDELKTKGKAAADVIGVKLGKASSAFLQSLIFMIIPTATYQSLTTSLMIIFMVICGIWLWAVFNLSKEYRSAILTHKSN